MPGGGAPLGGLGGTTPPTVPLLTKLKQSASRWRMGTTSAKIARAKPKRPPLGTVFSFTLDRASALSATFVRRVDGRIVQGRCGKLTHARAHLEPCLRRLPAGILHIAAHAGANTLRFSGRLTKKLRPGHGAYAVTFRAIADGLTSQPSTAAFTVVSG